MSRDFIDFLVASQRVFSCTKSFKMSASTTISERNCCTGCV